MEDYTENQNKWLEHKQKMSEAKEIMDDASVERIVMSIMDVASNKGIDVHQLLKVKDTHFYIQKTVEHIWLTVLRKVLVQDIDEICVDYPSTWWDHFKSRWFPKWLCRRFPVKMKTIRLTAKAIYDSSKIAIPEAEPNVYFDKTVFDKVEKDA